MSSPNRKNKMLAIFSLFAIALSLFTGFNAEDAQAKISSPKKMPLAKIYAPTVKKPAASSQTKTQTQSSQKSNPQTNGYPLNAKSLNTLVNSSAVETGCSEVRYDGAVNRDYSIVEYSANPKGYHVKVNLANYGNTTITNVRYQVMNVSTAQVLVNGSISKIEPCSQGFAYDFIVQTAETGQPLKIYQGENRFYIAVTAYDQSASDANLNNNRYDLTVTVPSVDLSVGITDYSYEPSIIIPENPSTPTIITHILKVNNLGNSPSGQFKTKFILNGVLDGEIAYPSINPGAFLSQTLVGTNLSRNVYNFVRAIVDSDNQVVEYNESRAIPETNNILNIELVVGGAPTLYTASRNFFMFTPEFLSNSERLNLKVPVLNIASGPLSIQPSISVYLNTCSGTPLKSATIPYHLININQTKDYLVSNFTSSDLQRINGNPICVQFKTSADTISRTITAGFPDLVVTNYSATLMTTQNALQNNLYRGTYLQYLNTNTGFNHLVTVKNIGLADAQNIAVEVYSNGSFDQTLTLPGPIAPNQELTFNLSPTRKAFRGFNIVKIAVDRANTVLETDETNNKALYELKVVNDQIVNGSIKTFSESPNFYLYQPALEDVQNQGRKYVMTFVNISDDTQNVKYQFKAHRNDNQTPDTWIFSPINGWTTGDFKEMKSEFQNPNTCYQEFESFVSYNRGNNIYTTAVLDNLFLNSDISADAQCIR